MKLTKSNYYGKKANKEFFSNSQVKDFMRCEAYAMAKISGDWVEEPTEAMLIGSYVDSYFEGTLEKFLKNNPQVFNKNGTLKAAFSGTAEKVIRRIESDELFMLCLSGKKQVMMSGEIFGAKFKIKMDSYLPDEAIVDLKVVKKLRDVTYNHGARQSFIEKNGYDLQLAIYQEIVRQNTGKLLDCIIAGADKQEYTDIDCILIPNGQLNYQLSLLENIMPRLIDVKSGKTEPHRCGQCDYCRATKKLENIILPEKLITN